MNIDKERFVEKIKNLIKDGETVRATKRVSNGGALVPTTTYYDTEKFKGWVSDALTVLEFYQIHTAGDKLISDLLEVKHASERNINAVQEQLKSILKAVEEGYIEIGGAGKSKQDAEIILQNVFNKFHKVARQLRARYDSRETLKIKDEYDVQDLLHALLQLHFDDIRPEEWTPSYAGGSVRMDFLLKDEGIVIEVKKTRESLTQKKLGEELIIDRAKYKEHPDCKKMYCFVYDPEGILGNPAGIKKDLEKGEEDFIKVFIRPE